MCDTSSRRFFGSLEEIAQLRYNAEPPILVYTIGGDDTVRLADDEATAAWTEFIALWSKPLCDRG
jgi:hypothetical protein